MWMDVLPVHMCTTHVWCLRKPEEGNESLELQLKMAVSCRMGAGK